MSTNDKDLKDEIAQLRKSVTAMNKDMKEFRQGVQEGLKELRELIADLALSIRRQ